MKPVTQTKFSSLNPVQHGNCLAACLASILEIPLESIPTLEDMGDEWADEFFKFLESHGYEYEGSLWPKRPDDVDEWWPDLVKRSPGIDGYYIVGGKSPRSFVTKGHAVIYHNGVMVHDPHPSKNGLLSIEDIYMIERATT